MSKEYHRNDVADRSGWPSGPWDSEPDFYEWTTAAGYEAYMFRLDSGAWAASITAPHPSGMMLLAFSHHMRDTYPNDHQAGMITKTDIEGIGNFCLSMEHYAGPGPAYGGRTWNRGPYKTLSEVIQICEDVASHILETHEKGNYVNYFQR